MEPTLLDYYKAIEKTSRDMLTAAQQEDWDQLVRLEGACAVLIAQLRYKARTLPLETWPSPGCKTWRRSWTTAAWCTEDRGLSRPLAPRGPNEKALGPEGARATPFSQGSRRNQQAHAQGGAAIRPTCS